MKTPTPVRVAQLGCGYWGPNLLRNLLATSGCEVKGVVEPSPERRAYLRSTFPSVPVLDSPETAFGDPSIDALVIATPAKTHFPLALQALRAGKHVLVEKPLATSVQEVDALAVEAVRRNLVVMAGHTFLFNSAVAHVKKLIDDGVLGDVHYLYSQRLNLGRIRSDIDALWNFAPHDVSIIQHWLSDASPSHITHLGLDCIQRGIADVSFLSLEYPDRTLAHIHVSWLDPQKTRRMVVVGSKKMLVYDDAADDKIAVYDKGIDRLTMSPDAMHFDASPPQRFSYRDGDVTLPAIHFVEPLKTEVEHFLNCVRDGQEPITGIRHARTVVDILERATRAQGVAHS